MRFEREQARCLPEPNPRRGSETPPYINKAPQYFPYFHAVSYIASTFSVGELSCSMCVGEKQ